MKQTKLQAPMGIDKEISGKYTTLQGEDYFVIRNYDQMRPFFMTLVSATDHWLFISSNGALSAGRINPESALFPYYTDDKITDSVGVTGARTIIRLQHEGQDVFWEPFNPHFAGIHHTTSNLYKNREGNKIVFEETNHDFGLRFQYAWSFSEQYGIVKEAWLRNEGSLPVQVDLLDGIQNILPYGVASGLQNERSTLVDAYKAAEWEAQSELALYSLSSMIVDQAEPSEALKATTVWASGIPYEAVLLSSAQVAGFRHQGRVQSEDACKAEKGAFFIHAALDLAPQEEQSWLIVSEVNQSAGDIARLRRQLSDRSKTHQEVVEDVRRNKEDLRKKIGQADGIQLSNDRLGTGRHFSNVLFNIMRGGTFDEIYQIETKDFAHHIAEMNGEAHRKLRNVLNELPPRLDYHQLRHYLKAARHKDSFRYYLEYLPLSFSRRHGDPSRPWNYFSIQLKHDDGSKFRNYEGNWRDIFQNWEALAHSYPEFSLGMIAKFVNASTIDGYNPYRITRQGIDWEVIDPSDPWSHIGYWGDHQVIYLTKLLEFSLSRHPDRLRELLSEPIFTYANVPYRIKGYDAIVSDPKHTIVYDHEVDRRVAERVSQIGSDGKLVVDEDGDLELVNLTEKLLVMVLTKLYNFIPEAGIWLNTQRPEWNDANNALVGNGVSMVTLYYLRRFLHFAEDLFRDMENKEVVINKPVVDLLESLKRGFMGHQPSLETTFSPEERRNFMDTFGVAGEHYRTTAYAGFTHDKRKMTFRDILQFFQLSRRYLEHSIDCNKRKDGLYHSYNLLTLTDNEAHLSRLYKMLEGQVAVLSANYLSAQEGLKVLDTLKQSNMFREDQYSYMLYPDRELPGFLEKNIVPESLLHTSSLAEALLAAGDTTILERDLDGNLHFNGDFHHAKDLITALNKLGGNLRSLARREQKTFLEAFENVFHHRSFTGRSGSFYGYEGLGSIYWHMVSKLLLAIQENIYRGHRQGEKDEIMGRLIAHYYEVRAGIGVNKSPELYGAFPTDAYSHTPKYAGARQPGMTGQVKEDIINRWAELGIVTRGGQLTFDPIILRRSEFIPKAATLSCYYSAGEGRKIQVPANAIAFTYCQLPIIYQLGDRDKLTLHFEDGSQQSQDQLFLSRDESRDVFKRTGRIRQIDVVLREERLLD